MPPPDNDNPLVEALPPAVRAAVQAQDMQALDQALRQMPRDEAEALARWLVIAGILVKGTEPDRVADPRLANYPPAVAQALSSGNPDAVYAALAELPNEQADRLYEQLKQEGLL
jgi:hypothetical protein